MPIYDKGDTVPVRGVEVPSEDHPLLAVKYAEEHNLGPNDSIVGTFSPAEKKQLLKMIREGEFSQLEAAVLKTLMSEQATLEDVGAMFGAVSRRTKGEPLSKPGALKELNRILKIVAKQSKAKFGREVDLNQIPKYKAEMVKHNRDLKKKARKAELYAKQQEQEFYKLLKELHEVQDKLGIPRSQYYIRKFAPANKDISKMKRFGGISDYDND